jgi:general secretion pathway protein E
MQNQLSQIFIENYGLSEDLLDEARQIHAEKGGSIGQILVDQKNLSEAQLLEALKIQYDLPFWPKLHVDNNGLDFTEKFDRPL